MKKKSDVQKEVRRIQKYLSSLKRKYGDRILNLDDFDPKKITSKYKTKSVQLKHLKELTAQAIQSQLQMYDEETGEIVNLREQQRRNRSESQAQSQESKRKFWSGEDYLPLKEELEYNNLGEDIATMVGEEWNYQEFSLGNYKELNKIIDDQLAMKKGKMFSNMRRVEGRERGALVQNWLTKLTEEVGLDKVAQMINRYAGENPMNRYEIFYKEGANTEFMFRAMEYLDVDDETRRELYKKLDMA